MRFFGRGPSIPDELLLARDQGRVVFFCGSGVSRAKMQLPDFLGLAEGVIKGLRTCADSPALELLQLAKCLKEQSNLGGILPVDHIFSLLAQEFTDQDIQKAVAFSLKPSVAPDLSAHKTLLDLATTPDGIVRLVTTNFDRLFDDCGRSLPSWKPPRLPDPSAGTEFRGIVYLHGITLPDYSGAESDGFVLSSADFGRAYLSDGWATTFVQGIIDRYTIVFVGYGADDPPMHYLLEALSRTTGRTDQLFAFQSGAAEEASAKWRHRGVIAIPYQESEGHALLWQSLEAWAERARDPEKWYASVIAKAKQGPDALTPHERGQVAHVVSTPDGMRRFAADDGPPPAQWLCVFDPKCRFENPADLETDEGQTVRVDPFSQYGLDSDTPPETAGDLMTPTKREVPDESWDGFAFNHFDIGAMRDVNYPAVRGHRAAGVPDLPPRLREMGRWIGKVAPQPAAVWWAARQFTLHPEIRQWVRWCLSSVRSTPTDANRKAWRYLLEHFVSASNGPEGRDRRLLELQQEAAGGGWNCGILRQYAALLRPYVDIEPGIGSGPLPPGQHSMINESRLVRLDVKYPKLIERLDIPADWLAPWLAMRRANLELALALEAEVGSHALLLTFPIATLGEEEDTVGRDWGLSGALLEFAKEFERLSEIDHKAAHTEFTRWPAGDDTVFARLRIWASSNPVVVLADDCGALLNGLSDKAFWDPCNRTDLLATLSSRWSDLSDESRGAIESRLLGGPSKEDGEETEAFEKRRAQAVLDRTSWLTRSGCEFKQDLDATYEELRKSVPEWQPESCNARMESVRVRGGWVQTNTEHSALLREPLVSVLSKALEMSGRREDLLVEYDPFAGLSEAKPLRAFAALRREARKHNFPKAAWKTFLTSKAREKDIPRFVAFVAEQLTRYPRTVISELIYAVCDWFWKVRSALFSHYPGVFDRLLEELILVLALEPNDSRSIVLRTNREPDWIMEAINSPAGKLAMALLDLPGHASLKTGDGFPPAWFTHAEALLALPGDQRRYALVVFGHHLDRAFSIDPEWSMQHLLSVLGSDDEHAKNAWWRGFLWGSRLRNPKLYMHMKPHLLRIAQAGAIARHGHLSALSSMILMGWRATLKDSQEPCVSDQELTDLLVHTDDEFRSQILWHAQHGASETIPESENRWRTLLPELLRDVWPQQKAAKSPTISARLAELTFSLEEMFPVLADVVLPLLTKIDNPQTALFRLTRDDNRIIKRYPRQVLGILDAILPVDAAKWPYGTGDALARIGGASSALRTDARFLELKRRWDSR